jgi:hypothetical protein
MSALLPRSEPFAKPKNFITLQKRMNFSEVTGDPRRARPSRRALSFREVSMGEAAGLLLDRAGAMGSPAQRDLNVLMKRLSPDPWIGKLKKSSSSL